MATLKEFEEALKAAGNTAALEILDSLRARDRSQRSIRPARRLTGRKMTPELAAEILQLHETTSMTQQEIAFQLGVNQGRVNEVIKRRKWLDGDANAPEAQTRDKAKERAREGVGFTPKRPAKKKAAKGEPVAAAPEPAALEPAAPEPVAPEPVVPEPVLSEPVLSEPVAPEPPPPSPPESVPELPMPMTAGEQPAKASAKAPAKAKAARKPAKASEPPAQLPFKDLF